MQGCGVAKCGGNSRATASFNFSGEISAENDD
jgi:hypothetical protein